MNQFGSHFLTAGKVDPVRIAYLTFLGPLVGSLIRPVGGWLADRVGGARTTAWNFLAMAAAGVVVLAALWGWLERGAHVYVCGDAARMARDVDRALHGIVARHGGMSQAEAAAHVRRLATDHRYVRDVY